MPRPRPRSPAENPCAARASGSRQLSVVTPSFNQGRFIERTIRSVIEQGIPDLEYFVADGGSSDQTVPVLRSFGDRLRWVSEPDSGQADAVNKGLRATRGEIIGWLNSDDVYYPGAIAAVREFFARHPEIDVVYGDAHHVDEEDRIIESYYNEPWHSQRLQEVCYLCQPAVFFRRRVIDRCGLLDAGLRYCMDYEYWLRLDQCGMRFAYLRRYLAGSRLYTDNKTLGQRVAVHAEINQMMRRRLSRVPDRWLANYAHIVLEETGIDRDRYPRGFALAVTALTWYAALRWNRRISTSLRRQCRQWLRAGFATRIDDPAPARPTPDPISPGPPATAQRIGFDVSQTGSHKAGCGWFADALLRSLLELDERRRYLLYPSFGDRIQDPEEPQVSARFGHDKVSCSPAHATPEAGQAFWHHPPADLEKVLGYPDIVHSNSFFCPRGLATARLVYTLYDVHFLEHPEWTTAANHYVCFNGVFQASLHADMVMAISAASRDHFLEIFPHYPEQRTAVVEPASRLDSSEPVPVPPSLQHLPEHRFFLSVGTFEPRKNLRRLLHAYAAYLRDDNHPHPLVLAGGEGWLLEDFDQEISTLGLGSQVLRLGYVSEHELQWLYQSCLAFVFPSLAEGFGLPVLEAASQGAAVIASRVPAVQEAAGDAALLVDPSSEPELKRALARVARDSELRRRLQAAGRRHAARFSWRSTAEQALAVYQQVLLMEKYTGAG